MSEPEHHQPAVVAEHVSRRFRRGGALLGRATHVDALADVSLTVPRRSRFGIVGESGSGKSTLLRLVAGLDRPTSGRLVVDGVEVGSATRRELAPLRGRLQMVFQDPTTALSPRLRIGDVVAEPLRLHGVRDPWPRVREVLERVGLDPDTAHRYPHQFSGGQRQRIAIARAIAVHPAILLADEAVSALDVTVRAQVLTLLDEIATLEELTLVFVSHDLSVIRRVCDRVAVMHRGRLVEEGPTEEVYTAPREEYTRRLLAAVPTLRGSLEQARKRAG